MTGNHLRRLREERGMAAAALARACAISRQTVYAIEAGDYVPNTEVALRMARLLEVRVEDLFELEEPEAAPPAQPAEWLGTQAPEAGAPVRICRVGERAVAIPAVPASPRIGVPDGVVRKRLSASKIEVVPFPATGRPVRQLVVSGCDPAAPLLAQHLLREAGIELVIVSVASRRSLELLRRGAVHIAGTHLRDPRTGESNLPAVRKAFPEGRIRLVAFAGWEQGLVVAKGNPKAIAGIADAARADLRFVNRESGAGSRLLFDTLLGRAGIESRQVQGYERIARGHLEAAFHVHAGAADYCLATRAAARALQLEFIPVAEEHYDFAVAAEHFDDSGVQAFFDLLPRLRLRQELEAYGGYDLRDCGKILL